MYRAASVKSNAKLSRLVPSYLNTSPTASRITLLLTLLLLSSGRHSIRNVSFGVSKLPTCALMYSCLSTSASSTKILFCPEVVLEYSFFGTLMEQRLHGLQFQKANVFPLQQTEILKQDDLVYGVGYLQLETKRLLFSWRSLDRVVQYIGLLTLRAAGRYQFRWVKLTFSVTFHKNFFTKFNYYDAKITSQIASWSFPKLLWILASYFPNFKYFPNDFACLGIFILPNFSKLYNFKKGMCWEHNVFIGLCNWVAIMHFVLTMRTENLNFFQVYLRTQLYCELLWKTFVTFVKFYVTLS